MKYEVKE